MFGDPLSDFCTSSEFPWHSFTSPVQNCPLKPSLWLSEIRKPIPTRAETIENETRGASSTVGSLAVTQLRVKIESQFEIPRRNCHVGQKTENIVNNDDYVMLLVQHTDGTTLYMTRKRTRTSLTQAFNAYMRKYYE